MWNFRRQHLLRFLDLIDPLSTEYKPVSFGGLLGLEEGTAEPFDKDRPPWLVAKNIALRAPVRGVG